MRRDQLVRDHDRYRAALRRIHMDGGPDVPERIFQIVTDALNWSSYPRTVVSGAK